MQRFPALAVIAVCQVAVMALWFSASAIVPALKAEGAIDPQSVAFEFDDKQVNVPREKLEGLFHPANYGFG